MKYQVQMTLRFNFNDNFNALKISFDGGGGVKA